MGKNNKMAVASSNSAPHHSIRYGITKKGIEENHKERNHEKNIVEKQFVHKNMLAAKELVGESERYVADQMRAENEGRLVDDYIKSQDMNRQEKTKFLRLFELGIYYVDKGKVRIDNKKYKELLNLYHSNTEFDKKVERKAMKAYNKYAKKAFGPEFMHDTLTERRVAADANLRNVYDYDRMLSVKESFLKKYKKKYEKKRQRYIKKEFKKRYRFNKWKNKYGYTL